MCNATTSIPVPERRTVPAALSAEEQILTTAYPKWGKPTRRETPVAKRSDIEVALRLAAEFGVVSDPEATSRSCPSAKRGTR